jgi:hypothetical protein
VLLPAPSVAVQVTVRVPAALVSTAPQLTEATPETASEASAVAVAAPPTKTGLGVTTGESVGPVLSNLIVRVCGCSLLPARSVA